MTFPRFSENYWLTNPCFPESFLTEAWLRGNRSILQHNHYTQEANLLCIHAATYQALPALAMLHKVVLFLPESHLLYAVAPTVWLLLCQNT
ncbi:hypothetical protein FZN30_05210 [Escherichia coli]|nr:hypothetical protein [Escherichia coli]EEV6149300.1 hypothetical protein [Escherichia coli]EEX2866807.1 hypothetical protein [Escherichia coli]EEY5732590.1 hypothetical protein [Escherichia coli]EFA4465095.1 hypothetical protein [Escherichia coli]